MKEALSSRLSSLHRVHNFTRLGLLLLLFVVLFERVAVMRKEISRILGH
jgi:hypothetical protein